MANIPASLASVARGEVGYHEGKTNGHWNNDQKYSDAVPGLAWSDGQPWCATFVAWVAMKAGAAALFPRTASCLAGVAWFRARGRWSEYPAVGAQVFYGAGNGGTHTGLVVAFDADTITTVEGNTNSNGSAEGDGVYVKTRRRRDAYVYGYGVPAFDGLVSADPRWGGRKSGSVSTASKPSKGAPAAYTPPKFPAGLAPNRSKPSAVALQRALKAAGYMPKSVKESPNYGPQTQAAVVRFHNEHPQYRATGVTRDPAIGPKGWAALHRLAHAA
ncbi:CHAP domain-containing protein [Streptomyces sp. ME02-6991-2B]|nr:CHAP domain-containing protein [Streptomyces sp. ME02-6991-2B]